MLLTFPLDIANLPTQWGEFVVFTVPGKCTDCPHAVLVNQKFREPHQPALVRVHSECLTGDIFGSLRCDCEEQLHLALERIGQEGGVLIYARQEGRGVGLANKIKAYHLQDQGFDTIQAQEQLQLPVDSRTYESSATILRNLGLTSIRLLTNNPQKIVDLTHRGITVVERVSLEAMPNPYNHRYLETKKNKLGHLLTNLTDVTHT